MLVGSVALNAGVLQPYSTAATNTAASTAATTFTAVSSATLSGYSSASSGGTAFLTTLLGSSGTTSGSAPFDVPGLNALVSSFQSTLSGLTSNPLQPPSLDSWLATNGFAATPSSDLTSQVSAFAEELSQFTSGLGNSAMTPQNVVAGQALQLSVGAVSAVNGTYVVNTGILDLSTVGQYAFDSHSIGVRVVTPSSIGFSAQSGTVSFDSDAFAAAYASDPTTTLATFNAMVGGVNAAVGSYSIGQQASTSSLQAASAYQSAAARG
jgi:hypothetical protein